MHLPPLSSSSSSSSSGHSPPSPLFLFISPTFRLLGLYGLESDEAGQDGPDLLDVQWDAAGVIDLFKSLAGDGTTHVGALGGGEEGHVTQFVDPVFPLPTRLLGRVDVLEALPVGELDGVADPARLDLDAAGPVAQECGTVRAVWFARSRQYE